MTAANFLIGIAALGVGYLTGNNVGIALGIANMALAVINFVNKGQIDA